MPNNKNEENEQVNVQAVCEHLNLGRFHVVLIATQVARMEGIRPHDALKKILEIEDIEVYFKEMKEKQIKAEFNKKF